MRGIRRALGVEGGQAQGGSHSARPAPPTRHPRPLFTHLAAVSHDGVQQECWAAGGREGAAAGRRQRRPLALCPASRPGPRHRGPKRLKPPRVPHISRQHMIIVRQESVGFQAGQQGGDATRAEAVAREGRIALGWVGGGGLGRARVGGGGWRTPG